VSALPLAAVGGLEGQGGVALPADLLVAVELLGDGGHGGVHGASSQSENEMQRGLLLDVVVGETAAVCVSAWGGEYLPAACPRR
jgi:hypothetical protein